MSIRRIATAIAVAITAVVPLLTSATPAEAAPPIKFMKIHYKQTGTNLNTEYVVLKNTTGTRQTLTGWKVISSPATDNQVYKFPRTRLAAGASLTLYTGRGTNTAHKRYWGSSGPIWNNDG